MKKIIPILILAITLSNCGGSLEEPNSIQTAQEEIDNLPLRSVNSLGKFPYNSTIDELTVMTIDNCEYIVCNANHNSDITITHKGNCKYCEEKNQKLMESYIRFIRDSIR